MSIVLPPRIYNVRKPVPRRQIYHRRFESLPPLEESDNFKIPSLQCHSVLTSPAPHHPITETVKTSMPNLRIFQEETFIDTAPKMPKRMIHQRVVRPKPKTKRESPFNLENTEKALLRMKKQKIKFEHRNAILDEKGHEKEIDPIWLSPTITFT